MTELLNNLDAQLLMAVNSMHTPVLDTFMRIYTGKWIWAPLYLSLLWYLRCRMGWRKALLVLLAIIATIAIADQTCSTLLRPIFQRPRPSHSDNPLLAGLHIVNGYRGGSYGFPSCHAANSMALAMWFVLLGRMRSPVCYMLVFWAILNCYTRMYLGVHYPGDLLFGTTVGISAAAPCYCALRFATDIPRISGRRASQIPLATFGLTFLAIAVYAAIV